MSLCRFWRGAEVGLIKRMSISYNRIVSPKERRAFASGYRFALRRARRELDEMAERLDNELAELDAKMRAAHQQTVRDIGDEFVGLMVEMRGIRDEFHRLKAVERAVVTERDPNALLN